MEDIMRPFTYRTNRAVPGFSKTLTALALLSILGLAAPVHAQERHERYEEHRGRGEGMERRHGNEWRGNEWHGYGWDEHERRAREWRRLYPQPYPGVVYAPPPVYYEPPPPSPGFTLILPLDIR